MQKVLPSKGQHGTRLHAGQWRQMIKRLNKNEPNYGLTPRMVFNMLIYSVLQGALADRARKAGKSHCWRPSERHGGCGSW
jgi:hypothetical protein